MLYGKIIKLLCKPSPFLDRKAEIINTYNEGDIVNL